jgi:hypothetical protein
VAVVLQVAQGLTHAEHTLLRSYSPAGQEATQVPPDKKALVLDEELQEVHVVKSVLHVKHGLLQVLV